jgi:hypothetical protein
MSFVEDVFKGGNIATGLGVGLGMAILGPVVLPVVGAVFRPVAKTAIKMGMMAYDTAAEGISQASGATTGAAARTGLGALFSEARAEVDAERAARPKAADPRTDAGKDRPATRAANA